MNMFYYTTKFYDVSGTEELHPEVGKNTMDEIMEETKNVIRRDLSSSIFQAAIFDKEEHLILLVQRSGRHDYGFKVSDVSGHGIWTILTN